MKFLTETFYELLLNKTIVFIVVPLVCFAAWFLGDDEIINVFGMIGFFFAIGFAVLCYLNGLLLRALDKERWQAVRDNAHGGGSFFRTPGAWILGIFGLLLLISTVGMLVSGTQPPSFIALIVLDVLAVIYIVLFVASFVKAKDK